MADSLLKLPWQANPFPSKLKISVRKIGGF